MRVTLPCSRPCVADPLTLSGALPCQEFRQPLSSRQNDACKMINVPHDGVRTFLPFPLCCGGLLGRHSSAGTSDHPASDKRGIELARYRNMRSKYQCSLCLQFALILGAGPVLHRPTSLVIHRLEWYHLDTLLFYLIYIYYF
jgi:hypothetical protein